MNGGYINLASLRPWWLRLAILVLIATPILGVTSLPNQVGEGHIFEDLAAWTAYSGFIWIFIWMVVGLEHVIVWLSISAIFGVTVAILGGLFRKLGIWDILEHLVKTVTGTDPTAAMPEVGLVLLLIRVTATVPIAMLVMQSFPASDFLHRANRPNSSTRMREVWLAAAIFVRVFQHVFEVAGRMLLAWREENPSLILPRYRHDWKKGHKALIGFFGWLIRSGWAWSMALLQQSLLFVPIVVRDWGRFADEVD